MYQFHSYLSLVESLEAVADRKHFMAFSDSHSDSRAHGGVHTCCRCADVQHCNVKGALRVTESSGHTRSTLRNTVGTQRREHLYTVRPYVITPPSFVTFSSHLRRESYIECTITACMMLGLKKMVYQQLLEAMKTSSDGGRHELGKLDKTYCRWLAASFYFYHHRILLQIKNNCSLCLTGQLSVPTAWWYHPCLINCWGARQDFASEQNSSKQRLPRMQEATCC